MESTNACLEYVLKRLRECRGFKALKVLTFDEKRLLLQVEEKTEEKITFGMCKTLNQGVKEALQRDYTVAIIMDTAVFEYPHHPHMLMVCGDTIIGEQIKDPKIIEELKKKPSNFFLWENFIIYTERLPKGREDRQKLRMIYTAREPPQLEGVSCVDKRILGTPSTEGDAHVKQFLFFASNETTIGTCLIGFNIKEL